MRYAGSLSAKFLILLILNSNKVKEIYDTNEKNDILDYMYGIHDV